MTDINKYRNVSLTHETYEKLISLSKLLLPDAKLSISKTIESITNEKLKKLYDWNTTWLAYRQQSSKIKKKIPRIE